MVLGERQPRSLKKAPVGPGNDRDLIYAAKKPQAPSQRCIQPGINTGPAYRNLNRKPLWTGRLPNCLLSYETAPPSPSLDESCLRPQA